MRNAYVILNLKELRCQVIQLCAHFVNANVYKETSSTMELRLDFLFKTVSYPSDRRDVSPIVTEILSQQFHMGIQRSVIAVIFIAPDP